MHRFAIALTASALLLALAASCGGSPHSQDSAFAPDAPAQPQLTVLPDTWQGGGSAESVYLSSRDLGDSIELDINARGASGLQALFFELDYDSGSLSPAGVSPSELSVKLRFVPGVLLKSDSANVT